MRIIWSRGTVIVALSAAVVLFLVFRKARQQPTTVTPAPEISAAPPKSQAAVDTNAATSSKSKVLRTRRGELTDAEIAELKDTFEKRLKPAVTAWCEAYAGHVPFKSEDLSPDNFLEEIGRGKSAMYVFMLNGATFGIADVNESAQVSYLNTPGAKKLMALPNGAPPSTDVPVTRNELARMLKADSGTDFLPAEIRIIPTAFSSAMNGGANVNVGGDPVNIASWKFTLVFGPDGNLNYYLRGQK